MRRQSPTGSAQSCFILICSLGLGLPATVTFGLAKANAQTVLAAIGDWGDENPTSAAVADMVKSEEWDTDYVISLGDNTYEDISLGHPDWNDTPGLRYGSFMLGRADNKYPNQTSVSQRFFPTIGNHDTPDDGSALNPGYTDFFHTNSAGNPGRLPPGVHNDQTSYYDVVLPIEGGTGTIHLFTVDSDRMLVSDNALNTQQSWLQDKLKNSSATWKLVFFHHTAFSSFGLRPPDDKLRLDFQQWGADAVLAGHDHFFERIRVSDSSQTDMLYLVNGLGGRSLYPFGLTVSGSEFRYNDWYGAQRISITDTSATFEFRSLGESGGVVEDTFTLSKNSLIGDFDNNGTVDLADVDFFSAHFNPAPDAPAVNFNADLDLDNDNVVALADHDLLITTLVHDANGAGALIGDLNLDGDVDISEIVPGTLLSNIGDASVLLANLGTTSGALASQGDLNSDGDVDVSQIVITGGQVRNLGDASRLLANLGRSTASEPTATAVPEPGSPGLTTLMLMASILFRRGRSAEKQQFPRQD